MDLAQEIATSRINRLISNKVLTRQDLSEALGISRVTLNVRLNTGNWKKSELVALKEIK